MRINCTLCGMPFDKPERLIRRRNFHIFSCFVKFKLNNPHLYKRKKLKKPKLRTGWKGMETYLEQCARTERIHD